MGRTGNSVGGGMNLAKMWRQRRWLIEELRDRAEHLQHTIDNRNDLIAMQDEEITRLRRALRDAEQATEYWQAKAANP